MKTLILLLAWYSSVIAHDVPLAIFHIYEGNDEIQINISMDLEDFQAAASVKKKDMSLKKIQTYFDQNISFQFNSQSINPSLTSFDIVGDHIKIKGTFGKLAQKITTLKIENNCLVNVSGHSNIIQVDLNGKSRDFRMHKERKEITITY